MSIRTVMFHLLRIAQDAVVWTSTPSHAGLCLCAVILVRVIARRWLSPLRRIPGPWLASCTRLWKLYHTLQEDMQSVNIDLHRRYGFVPIVGFLPISKS